MRSGTGKTTGRTLPTVLALLLAALALLCGGCAEKKDPPKRTEIGYNILNTVVTLTAYTEDEQLLKDALAECKRLESILSRTVEGSDVWRVNHAEGAPVEVSGDTAEVLRCALRIAELSEGAFDITIAPVSTLWDFTSGAAVLPGKAEIAEAAKRVDYTRLVLEGNTVTLPEGMMIDLGGIAKGYIADRIAVYLKDRGVKRAILSFGGNIIAIGEKPDGSAWRVGIQDIDRPTGEHMLVSLSRGGSIVTSGIYERGFDLDGIRYHHLLSPRTGWPAQNELASVTIFTDSSMEADALATAAFVLGLEKGLAMIESLENVEAVFICRDRKIVCSGGAGAYLENIPEPEASPTATAAAGNPEEDGHPFLTRVDADNPATAYVLVRIQDLEGLLPLPAAGEYDKTIRQVLPDGSETVNVLHLTPDGFHMAEADCEGQDCVQQGEVTLENRESRVLWNMIICLPHQLSAELITREEAEALSE